MEDHGHVEAEDEEAVNVVDHEEDEVRVEDVEAKTWIGVEMAYLAYAHERNQQDCVEPQEQSKRNFDGNGWVVPMLANQ